MPAEHEKANLRVAHLPGLTEAFKQLAAARTQAAQAKNLPRVWVQDLHEEAIRDLLDRLKRGEKVVFFSSPLKSNVHKTMWLDRDLLTQAKEVAAQHNVAVATFVLTACLAYLEAQGIALE